MKKLNLKGNLRKKMKNNKKPTPQKIINSVKCPFLIKRNRRNLCTHKPHKPRKHKGLLACPYTHNRKRCGLWKDSHTRLKPILQSLKTAKEINL